MKENSFLWEFKKIVYFVRSRAQNEVLTPEVETKVHICETRILHNAIAHIAENKPFDAL